MTQTYRIIIAGGRDFNDFDCFQYLCKVVDDWLDKLEEKENIEPEQIKFISGCARGADRLGEKYAYDNGFKIVQFPADWDKYGKSAGYIRNTEMAKYAVADGGYGVLFAFWDGESRGTKNMIETAEKYGLEVNVFKY